MWFSDPDGNLIYVWQPPHRESKNFKNVEPIVKHYELVSRALADLREDEVCRRLIYTSALIFAPLEKSDGKCKNNGRQHDQDGDVDQGLRIIRVDHNVVQTFYEIK